MSTVREQAIEAGARALDDEWRQVPASAITTETSAAAVVDAVEPIIRADERSYTRTAAGVRERLRAQVEALPYTEVDLDPDPHGRPIERRAVLLSDVLALLDGEPNG